MSAFPFIEQPTASALPRMIPYCRGAALVTACASTHHQVLEKMPQRKAVHLVCLATFFLLLTPASSFVFVGGPCARAPTRRHGTLKHGKAENGKSLSPSLLWTIPIFPLQKSIRLPGETLTLNLYEKRYLALAAWIRDNQTDTQQAFGALYASNKPQIVSDQGTGPIVPLLQPGDIGVLFPVQQQEEGMIPTRSMDCCRRIRIVGTGVARFYIKKLLHNGYGGGENVGPEEALPFILAQVRLYCDNANDSSNNEPSSLTISSSRYNQNILSDDEIVLLLDRAKAMGIPHTVMQEEFQSFLTASTALPEGICDQRKDVLKSRSITHRMRTLL
eukprot:scaffold8602_cov196-Amphora_coffeaeformis.AAC.5